MTARMESFITALLTVIPVLGVAAWIGALIGGAL